MGISEREYRAMLAGNPELVVADDPGAVTAAQLERAVTHAKHVGPQCPTEHEEQVALFQWAEANEGAMPELRNLVAFPNGGYRPMATAAALKAEGVKAGLPDLALLCRRGSKGALFIEMKKADRSNKPTPAQAEWIERLHQSGYQAVVCYGAEEAIDAIRAYLALT